MIVDGCTAIVTGGSSGIGLALAELLASRGADVAIVARDQDRLAAARVKVEAARRSETQRVLDISCDVSVYDDVTAMVRRVEDALGPVDLLATCAGFCTPRRFTELDVSEFAGHLDANLLGVIYPARAVTPGMMQRGRGHIAMVSSIGGFLGVYGYSAYSAAKFGVMGLAEVLRCELKPHGIGVSVLCPPNVDTPGYARELTIEPPETAKINGSVKAVSPESMASVFLAAIERDRYLVIPGVLNKIIYRLKGLVPELFFAIFDHDVAAVRAAHGAPSEETAR